MTDILYENWEPVIGLEIHVQLKTKSKIFSPAPNRFGDEPNTNIGVVDTGQPGSLPVLNKEAVRKAVQFGLAIRAHIPLFPNSTANPIFIPTAPATSKSPNSTSQSSSAAPSSRTSAESRNTSPFITPISKMTPACSNTSAVSQALITTAPESL